MILNTEGKIVFEYILVIYMYTNTYFFFLKQKATGLNAIEY